MLRTSVTVLALSLALVGCSLEVRSATAIQTYVLADLATAAPLCDTPVEPNSAVETLHAGGLTYRNVVPHGMICARDASGRVTQVFRTELSRIARYRWTYEHRFFVFPGNRFELLDQTGQWRVVAD